MSPHILVGARISNKCFYSPILTGSQRHKSPAAPCLSIAPAKSPIHCIFPALCGGRKRVVLIEPLLDLSNLGNLRRRHPASIPLNYPVGTCSLKEVISRSLPGLVMCIRTESLQFYRNYSISHQ